MKIQREAWPKLPLFFTTIYLMAKMAISDPQINLLGPPGCSQYKVNDAFQFQTNINTTFSQLQSQLNSGKYFATAEEARGLTPIYTMIQCRKYLSPSDCLQCFTAAARLIRNCSTANGARVVYDGCFLRYESNTFYDQSTQEGHFGVCGNQTASQATSHQESVKSLLLDLQIATPKIDGLFIASKKEVGGGATVYGVAQCVETIGKNGCQNCLEVAHADLEKCFANVEGRATNVGCFVRYSDRPFFADNQTIDLTPFLKNGNSSKKKAIIAGVAAGVGLLLLSLALFTWFKVSGKERVAHRGNLLGATELRGPVNYSYKDLKSATKNFSEEHKLREGGFGEVYKGVLKNGKIVAVKKLAVGQSHRAKAEFEGEVRIISNIHHRNLVRLLGCCSNGPELLLVYEYMEKSSLDKFLFGERKGSLSWKQWFDIIIGTARGLAYVHEDFHLGYTAPEYAIYGQLFEKADTYSYGVVVLEVISGQKSTATMQDPTAEYLLKKAWKLYETGMHMELVDESINPEEYEAEEVKKIIEIALMCTQQSPSSRPPMSEVVVLLKSKGALQHEQPMRPAFIDPNEKAPQEKSTSTASADSNATASISQVSGR